MIIPYDRMLRIIDASDILQYVQESYPNQYQYFDRFRKANGNSCRFVRAALKEIYLSDSAKQGKFYLILKEQMTNG